MIGGVTPDELDIGGRGLSGRVVPADGFLLAPLPNHLFSRDTSCWIYGGVSLNPMAKPARRRETVHLEAIYRFHPTFAAEDFTVWYGGVDDDWGTATVEGGDVLVIGNGAVLVGMGERTTPAAIERIALRLFDAGAASTVIVVELPKARSYMHLDTVMTMIDRDAFVMYPGVVEHARAWSLTAGDGAAGTREIVVKPEHDLFAAIARSPRPRRRACVHDRR